MKNKTDIIENIPDEVNDDYSDDSIYNITSWGADLTYRELVTMYDEEELVKPELQRNYVWDKVEASRFVESILLGLPIPSIFLASSESQKLIVDGYQRIMTVHDYIKGIFSKDHKEFKLSNSNKINKRWRNKSFKELSIEDQRKIKSSTIHAIIFQQNEPKDGYTSMYQIFERINTSGRTLNPQEIRNCIYQGSFNTLLIELNNNPIWRTLFGLKETDSRMRDMEFILRFLMMKSDQIRSKTVSQISLKKELNLFMQNNRNASEKLINQYRNDFINTINYVYEEIGEKAFLNYNNGKFTHKFHPAIYDSIMCACYDYHLDHKENVKVSIEKHIKLLQNNEFEEAISNRTTNIENIRKRVSLAKKYLYGAEGDHER